MTSSDTETPIAPVVRQKRGSKIKTKPPLNTIHLDMLKKFWTDEHKLETAIAKGKQVEENKKKIQQLKKKKQEYFAKNAKFIFSYYENKSNIESGAPTTEIPNLHKYFEQVSPENIELSHYTNNTVRCQECGKGEKVILEEGSFICNKCSAVVHLFIENDKPMNNDEMMDESVYKYHPFNHFKEVVAQFQGKESTTLPEDLMTKINIQIRKERITTAELNYDNMRKILRKLHYSKYYEHIFYILKLLNIPPYYFTYEEEQKLYALFKEIQSPFSLYCSPNRVNFLNYYYILRALCIQAGITGCLPLLPGLVEPEKVNEHNMIYKQIATHLGWKFHPMSV